jgi:putative sterol carrier protein
MKLGSSEYLEEAKRRSNADAQYLKLAKGSNDSFTLVLEPEPEKGIPDLMVGGFDNIDGKINEVWLGRRPTTFTLAGPYGLWVDILRGKLAPTKAIAMRRLRAKGPFLQLLSEAERMSRWVEILRTIPTEFEGDYAQYNFPGD